jgi:hypothetical protein
MIKFKSGVVVHPHSLRNPEISMVLHVTSGCDGQHSPKSKHYQGKAWDLRIRDFPGDVRAWVDRIKLALGTRYFVLLEPDHIHIQVNI